MRRIRLECLSLLAVIAICNQAAAEEEAVLEFAVKIIRLREVYSPDPNWEFFDWHKTADAILAGIPENKLPPPAHHYAEMSSAYVGDKPEAFNAAVQKHSDWLSENGFAIDVKKGSDEHFFNTFAPFARAQRLYVIALLLACFSWLKMSRGLSNTAFYLIGLALVLHTAEVEGASRQLRGGEGQQLFFARAIQRHVGLRQG